jgi:Fic family protein
MDTHRHLIFRKHWEISDQCQYQIGECNSLVKTISNTPLKPNDRQRLLSVSLIKGAQATTAIEGNTLSEAEIEKIQEGWRLPQSKEYLEIEVKNILNAFNLLLDEIVYQGNMRIITPDLIIEFHQRIGAGLGEHFDAIPGEFRTDNRIVGSYRAPEYKYVPELINRLCDWLRTEFHFTDGQDFKTAVVQAIVAHVYIEWIHPFGDGNGRTCRLLEFYILLRSGLPDIVSHILSNFYNETRSEYYRQLDNARKKRDLSHFISYAVHGFRDGLIENMRIIQNGQFKIFWHNFIYETFADLKYTKKEVFKRKREAVLEMPLNKSVSADEITNSTPSLAKKYERVARATVLRDLRELMELRLIVKDGKQYRANIGLLRSLIPPSRHPA